MYTLYLFVCSRCKAASDYVGDLVCFCPVCEALYIPREDELYIANLTYKEAQTLLKEVHNE